MSNYNALIISVLSLIKIKHS